MAPAPEPAEPAEPAGPAAARTVGSGRAWVLHVDLDQFIAAVEVLRRPELAGKPVIVGGSGDPTQRTVVATASYEAREFGVHSGMPMRTAAKKIPDAIFLPADNEAYEQASAVVMATLGEFDVIVEVLGWDEAFVGARTDDPEALARAIQARVLARTDLSCSVGIGDNRLRAKMATGFAKPAGVFRLTADTWYDLLGERGPDALWGIGSKTTKKLAELGITTVRQLAGADPKALAQRFGPRMGPWYVLVGRGISDTEVSATPWVPRSRSRETTFQQNLEDWDTIRAEVAALARRVTEDVVADGRPAVRVGLKVRFAPFLTRTASAPLDGPTQDPEVIAARALEVLDRFRADPPEADPPEADPPKPERPIRLLGVRAEFPPES